MGRFQPGDVAVDRDDPDAARMIVLDPNCGTADSVHIDAVDATVAALNPEYPPDDLVVECIHVDWLTRHAKDTWESWSEDAFPDRLRAYAMKWSLPLRTYSYPESRLRPETDSSTEGQARLDHW